MQIANDRAAKYNALSVAMRLTQNSSPATRTNAISSLAVSSNHSPRHPSVLSSTAVPLGEPETNASRPMCQIAEFPSISEKEADGADCHQTESECCTEDSRLTTPIEPNQERDGIKFMQVSDPNYKVSIVFDQCNNVENEITSPGFCLTKPTLVKKVVKKKEAARNDTGNQFYSNKPAATNAQP